VEQERHGSIFNTQSKDFPQRRIPPALFSLREQGVPRTSGAAYRKKKGFGRKKKVDSLKLGKFVLLAIVPVLA
jgi:hypothetical protein